MQVFRVLHPEAAVSSCEKGTQWPAACYLLQGLTDVISYNSCISSCRRAPTTAWQVAGGLFAEMSWKGIERNVLTHTEMVSTFIDSGQLKFGAGALNEIPLHPLLKQLAERDVHKKNIRPNTWIRSLICRSSSVYTYLYQAREDCGLWPSKISSFQLFSQPQQSYWYWLLGGSLAVRCDTTHFCWGSGWSILWDERGFVTEFPPKKPSIFGLS